MPKQKKKPPGKFSYRLFTEGIDTMLAISDASLIGKTLKDKERSVEITISDFYAGEKCSETEALKLIKGATIINAIGSQITKLLLKHKYVEKSNVLEISGVPHVQIIVIQ